MLTVKSAYHVAMADHYDQFCPGSSINHPSGDRSLWRLVWNAAVPPKLKNFAWQVASGALPTDAEKRRRHIGLNGYCRLCDREQESSFHALISCPSAANLWDLMQNHWPLPNRSMIKWTGTEWLFHLLAESHESIRSRIIMVLWRAWHLRNELVHGKSIPPPEVSCSFLLSYHNTFNQISRGVDEIIKGKSPVFSETFAVGEARINPMPRVPWPPPRIGAVALSVDGSFNVTDGSAGSGMILRNASGGVIFAAYHKLFHCNDALEAELHAILEGIKLTVEHSNSTIMVQSDCASALKAISDASLDRSAYGHMIQEIKFLLSDRVFVPVKISRDQNRVADCLANFGRCGDSTACWLGQAPPCASDLVAEDCNSVILE